MIGCFVFDGGEYVYGVDFGDVFFVVEELEVLLVVMVSGFKLRKNVGCVVSIEFFVFDIIGLSMDSVVCGFKSDSFEISGVVEVDGRGDNEEESRLGCRDIESFLCVDYGRV